jgi:hypothetical protein
MFNIVKRHLGWYLSNSVDMTSTCSFRTVDDPSILYNAELRPSYDRLIIQEEELPSGYHQADLGRDFEMLQLPSEPRTWQWFSTSIHHPDFTFRAE